MSERKLIQIAIDPMPAIVVEDATGIEWLNLAFAEPDEVQRAEGWLLPLTLDDDKAFRWDYKVNEIKHAVTGEKKYEWKGRLETYLPHNFIRRLDIISHPENVAGWLHCEFDYQLRTLHWDDTPPLTLTGWLAWDLFKYIPRSPQKT